MILGELKLDAEAHFGAPGEPCVITVPANFDDSQRQATREAATIAGLEVLRLINEPTAAALAYGLSRGFQGNALVFDLGGGTFDVSILEVEGRRLRGEGHRGRLVAGRRGLRPAHRPVAGGAGGGDAARGGARKDASSMRRLKVAAETAKRELTEQEEAAHLRGGPGGLRLADRRLTGVETVLTRAFFETLSEPLSRRCLAVCETVMQDAKMDPRAVDVVLLVGGMTRVPLVQRLVPDFFGRAPSTDVNPDEAVALGAAVHAEELVRQSGTALLLDVAGQSLGVGVLGGRVKRLIAKNTLGAGGGARTSSCPAAAARPRCASPSTRARASSRTRTTSWARWCCEPAGGPPRGHADRGDVRAVRRGHPIGARGGPAHGAGRGR